MSSNPGIEDNSQEKDKNNKDKFEWNKIDNKDKNLYSNPSADFYNTPQPIEPRFAILYFTNTVIPNVRYAISGHRSNVLGDLTHREILLPGSGGSE